MAESQTPCSTTDNNARITSFADSHTGFPTSFNGASPDSIDSDLSFEDVHSSCSTPYASASSSPGRGLAGGGFFYSAPASPQNHPPASLETSSHAFDFDFAAPVGSIRSRSTSMSSADELFLNGKIRPMNLLPEMEVEIGEYSRRSDLRLRRRTRSMSPESSEEIEAVEKVEERASETSTPSISGPSSRSSSAGRSSKRWIFLKDFLHRSKSEGRRNSNFWSNISFPHKKSVIQSASKAKKETVGENGGGKRRSAPSPSPHELHYTANRAHSEDMKKKTYLPYRQGLLGCLGFSSKGYGAVNGFAKALDSVSSR